MSISSVFPNVHISFVLVLAILVLIVSAGGCAQDRVEKKISPDQSEDGLHRFLVFDPGHFHASLVFKRPRYEGISSMVGIYAPVGEDFVDHMNRVIPFNTRKENPAEWKYSIHLGPDSQEALLKEKFGDMVILSGRNNEKIDRILACVRAGFNVLADKPWLIDPERYELLETALKEADDKGLVIYDMMTERHEITTILQQLIVNHEPLFGSLTKGSPDDPAVIKSSVHHLFKYVAGRPLKRSWWFFDTSIQGEGLVDITTHLVDLIFTILYPEQAIDNTKDIEMVSASHWPTLLSPAQYETITKKPEFPSQFVLDGKGNYPYYCNGKMNFRLKGVNCQAQVIWNYKAPEGTGDTHYSIIKGTRAHVLILQGKKQNFKAELYLKPAPGADRTQVGNALKSFIASLAKDNYPGLSVVEEKDMWRFDIPQKYHVGHEAHFGQVTDRFLEYLEGEPIPEWEKSNMLAKYFVTTKALELSRR